MREKCVVNPFDFRVKFCIFGFRSLPSHGVHVIPTDGRMLAYVNVASEIAGSPFPVFNDCHNVSVFNVCPVGDMQRTHIVIDGIPAGSAIWRVQNFVGIKHGPEWIVF